MVNTSRGDTVVLTRYVEVRSALSSRDLTRSIDRESFEVGNITEDTLATLHGSEHRERRRVENQLFRRGTLETYERVLFPDIVEHTLTDFVTESAGDLVEIGGLLTVVLASRIAGVDLDPTSETDRRRLREYLHLFALGTAIDVLNGDLDEAKSLMRTTLAEFDAEFVRASRQRREELLSDVRAGRAAEHDLPGDVLTTLLRARHDGQLDLDDGQLLREVTAYFAAGAHTSTQTLTNGLHLLFAWCREQPQDWQRLAFDSYFAQRAVQEALRCRPTNPMIHRRAAVDVTIGDRRIPAGTLVRLDTIAANTDKEAFGADAGSFNPHRRCPAEVAPWGISFGHGIHLCIGRTLSVGMPVRADTLGIGDDHLFGLVPQALQALVRRGVQPDHEAAPAPDTRTGRHTRWASYPIVFDPSIAPIPAPL